MIFVVKRGEIKTFMFAHPPEDKIQEKTRKKRGHLSPFYRFNTTGDAKQEKRTHGSKHKPVLSAQHVVPGQHAVPGARYVLYMYTHGGSEASRLQTPLYNHASRFGRGNP